MNLPYQLGPRLSDAVWQKVKFRTVFACCKWDIQSEDHCVLADFPLLITESAWKELRSIAQALSSEVIAAECELLRRPDLHGKLGLPKSLREQFARLDEPSVGIARIMRFDFHFTADGWRISEVNADVPGGFIEASGFTRQMAAHYPGTSAPPDPAAAYARNLSSQLGKDAFVGMIHATAYSDDRQVMQFLGTRMAEVGLRTIPASPAHVRWNDKRASISSSHLEARLHAIVRFFPAEWLPILRNKSQWTGFFSGSRTPISNPASAVLVQTKRFPLVWNSLSTRMPTWRSTLPETICPSVAGRDLTDWVVKPALGRVGEDIAISGVTPEDKLRRIHEAAQRRPAQWVAQRRFSVTPVLNGDGSYYPSIGVFTLDGTVAGAYARIARKPLIDDEAQDVAVLIVNGGGSYE